TKVKPEPGVAVAVQKILVTNDLKRTAAAVGELYSLRWQIEMFHPHYPSSAGLYLRRWAA
ncbi:MAG TPA: hypothetical protein VG013_36610, partial [Gemmataceae bacterium]|nr:hypothetical protein [Gemmataceae bacterium]